MIGRTNIGGGSAFAFIVTTYPTGSVCTATKGTRTIMARGTGGSFVFRVPEAGTWRVSATDGSRTTYRDVVISTEGQSVSVTLAYTLELIHNGTLNEGYAPNVSNSSYGSLTQGSGYVRFHVNSGTRTVLGYFTPQIDVSQYTNLHLEFYPKGGTAGDYMIGTKTNTTANTTFVSSTNGKTGSSSLTSIDVPVTSGTYYFAIYVKSGAATATDFDITEAVFS